MNTSKTIILSGLLALGLPLAASAGRIPVTLIESSVESVAGDLSLPGNEKGIITVRSCPTCSAQTFYFAKEHLLIVNGRQVDLPQLRAALQHDGKVPVSVYYRNSDSAVTRIVLVAGLSKDATQ